MNTIKPSTLLALTVLVSGCADTPRIDADYGSSVKQMVQAQTLDPAAASNPPELAPEMTDGARLQNALDVYRKDVAKGSTEVKQSVIFEVGNN
jgi:type IV pilus biogenesis protein CpaD/CtpE